MVVHERRALLAPPAYCEPSLSLSTDSVPGAHTPSQKPGARRPHASQKFSFTPGMAGSYLFGQTHTSLPCGTSHGSIIRYDKFEVFHFSAFFRVDRNSLCAEAYCEWSRCDAAAESNRRTLSCLGPRICLHELLKFCRFCETIQTRAHPVTGCCLTPIIVLG